MEAAQITILPNTPSQVLVPCIMRLTLISREYLYIIAYCPCLTFEEGRCSSRWAIRGRSQAPLIRFLVVVEVVAWCRPHPTSYNVTHFAGADINTKSGFIGIPPSSLVI